MKTKSLLLATLLATTLFLKAQDASQPPAQPSPQTVALAEELMAIFQVEKNMDTALAQVAKMQERMLDSQNFSPEAKARQQEMMTAVNAETKSLMSWEKVKPMFIAIYAETFTPEELQGMITFFKTPIGRKWIAKQPQLQMATMQKMQSLLADIQPKIQEIVKRTFSTPQPSPQPSPAQDTK